MKKTNTIFLIVFLIILGLAGFLVYKNIRSNSAAGQELIPFAQCLAGKNVTMYGTYWCPHCKNDKAKFGEAFQYVPYVECTVDIKKCQDAGVRGYPTWILPDGKKLEGEQGIDGFTTLSKESGCPLTVSSPSPSPIK